jgi:hypothetical protein
MPLTYSIEELEAALANSAKQAQYGLGGSIGGGFGGGLEEDPLNRVIPYQEFEQHQIKKQKQAARNPFIWLLDVLGATGYGTTGFLQGLISAAKGETDITTAFIQGAQGLSMALPFVGGNPEHRYTWSDTLAKLGWEPESKTGRFARGALGLALDVALDPLTYTGFGVSRHALKVGGATLNKAAARMATRFGREIAFAENIKDVVKANERLQDVLMPFVKGDRALRSRDTAEAILRNFGKPATEEAVEDLLENGLAKYMDRGGIKLMGRTIVRSATADAAGVAWDTALSRYIVQPAAKAVSTAGQAALKVKPIRGLYETGKTIKQTLSDFLGPLFISGYWMKDPLGRGTVRLFERARAFRNEAVDNSIEMLKTVADPVTGVARSVTEDEVRALSRAFHEADFLADPNQYAKLPDHLKPLADNVRKMLDESLKLERDIHGFEMGERALYWPQYWTKESLYATKEALQTGKLTPDEFDWFLKNRRVAKGYDDAVKMGLDTDFFRVLSARLKASASLITTQDFLQHMVDQYGVQFVKSGDRVLRKQGAQGMMIADFLKDLERASITIDGRPLTQAGRLGQAVDLARKDQREAALDALRHANPEMPVAEIDKAVDEVREAFKLREKNLTTLLNDLKMTEARSPELVHDLAGVQQHLSELETVAEKLRTRSTQRLLKAATRHPPAVPKPTWLGKRKTLEEVEETLLTTQQGVLGGRIVSLEGKAAREGLSEAEETLLRQTRTDLDHITNELAKTPEYDKTWAGFRHLSRRELDRHAQELRALGYSAEEAAAHVQDLQAYGATTLGITQEYSRAGKNYRRWAAGHLPTDDPVAAQLVRSDLDRMEGISRQVAEQEGALAAQETAFVETIQGVETATAARGFTTQEEARSLYLTQVELATKREGLNKVKKTLLSPDEIRAARQMIDDPRVGERALANTTPRNPHITPDGEVLRVPIHPVQAKAIAEVLRKQGVGKYAPELLERLTGARTFEDLSFQSAQEFLEIARRQPAKIREAALAGALEAIPDTYVRVPDFKSMRVQFGGEWTATRDISVPENVAKAIQQATTRWRPGPGMSLILGAYDRMQDLFKWSITLPWPAYWARNTIENTFKAFTEVGFAGMSRPEYMREYLLTLFGSTKPIRTAVGEIPRSAVLEGMREYGLLRRLPAGLADMGPPVKLANEAMDRIAGVFRGTGKAAEIQSINGYKLLDVLNKPPFNIPKKLMMFGTNLENATIFTFIVNRLDQGHTLERALEAASDVFFTFNHLTEFERNFCRRALPFYSYLRQAAPYTVHITKEHPWVMAALADIGQFGGGEEEYAPYVPGFVKNSLKFKLPGAKGEAPRYVVLNNLLTIDWSREFATENSNEFVRSVLGSMSPLITAPFEFALKKDFFFGGDIRDRQRISAVFDEGPIGASLKKWLNAREVKVGKSTFLAVDGERLWATRSFILARLYNSLVTLSRTDMAPQDKLLRLGMGLMSQKVDLERQQTLLRERAFRLQNEFKRSIRQGDTVRAEAILEDLRGD